MRSALAWFEHCSCSVRKYPQYFCTFHENLFVLSRLAWQWRHNAMGALTKNRHREFLMFCSFLLHHRDRCAFLELWAAPSSLAWLYFHGQFYCIRYLRTPLLLLFSSVFICSFSVVVPAAIWCHATSHLGSLAPAPHLPFCIVPSLVAHILNLSWLCPVSCSI